MRRGKQDHPGASRHPSSNEEGKTTAASLLSELVELRAGELHQLRVLLVLRAHQRVELLGCARADAHAEPGDLVMYLGRCDCGDDAGVELLDNRGRCSCRNERAQ